MIHQLRLFFIAVQFFTRIPIPSWVGFREEWLHQSVRYFACVGWIVGASSALCFYALAQFLPAVVAILFSMILSILMTGAFHEDGFADVCDGFGGGYSKDRVLEIMKDSRIGAYGAIGAFLMLGTKFTLLSQFDLHTIPIAILIAHPSSRWFSCLLIYFMNYARENGKAKPLAQSMSHVELLISTVTVFPLIIAVVMLANLPFMNILTCLVLMTMVTLYLARLFKKKIDGYTGDCLGAVQQCAEIAAYVGLLVQFKP